MMGNFVFGFLNLLTICIFCYITIVSCMSMICEAYKETHKPLTLADLLKGKEEEGK